MTGIARAARRAFVARGVGDKKPTGTHVASARVSRPCGYAFIAGRPIALAVDPGKRTRGERRRIGGRRCKGDRIMLRGLTITELIIAGLLCVFALGTARAAEPTANDRDACLKRADTEPVKATA